MTDVWAAEAEMNDRLVYERAQQEIENAIHLLADRGHMSAAACMADVQDLEFETGSYSEYFDPPRGWTPMVARLTVPLHLHDAITEREQDKIVEVLEKVLNWRPDERAILQSAYCVPVPRQFDPDWRDKIPALLGGDASNQARIGGTSDRTWDEDRLRFRSKGELVVYRALKRAAAKLRPSSLSIVPNAGVRIGNATWEPDLMVCYRGRVGIIEVDGSHHNGRAALDVSRDQYWRDNGIRHVARVPVEATRSDAEADDFVAQFLRHLVAD